MSRNDMLKMLDRSCHDGKDSAALSQFNAALQGIIASPAFLGPLYPGDPNAAVKFALDVCIAILGEVREPQP
jgi:hypothetical protein